jgi:hypothetical protein
VGVSAQRWSGRCRPCPSRSSLLPRRHRPVIGRLSDASNDLERRHYAS